MVNYVLNYFPGRGFGEVSRQLFQVSGTKFTDNRITQEEWPKHKANMPFGQMPVLEVDGKKIPQSFAIARYLAKEFGFAGKTPFEAAWVDALADQYKDYFNEFRPFAMLVYGFAQGDKAAKQKEVGEPARDKFFGILEKKLTENSSGYLVGDSLTWVDLVVADHVDILNNALPGFLDAFPKVVAHQKKIHSTPKLKEWIETRPKTPY